MKNVTITLDEETAHWARVEAAKAGKSLSRWLGDKLAREKTEMRGDGNPLDAFLLGPGYPGIAADLPTRDAVHDRES